METVGQSPPEDDDLQFLTQWGDPSDRKRHQRAAAASLLINMAVVAAAVLAPAAVWESPEIAEKIVTPLIAPLTAFTQKEPNKEKVDKEFDVAASQPRPRIQISPGQSPKPFNPTPPAPAPVPKPIAVPEPPKVEEKTPKTDLPQLAQTLAPPKIETVQQPKLVLEDPVAAPTIQPGQGRPLPKADAESAIQGLMSGGGRGGGPSLNMAPSAGLDPNKMRLLSDPMGVDFKPYLTQVLASVKRYWLAIWPQAARDGRSGRVVIQFSVDRFGAVPKLVIASGSGADALDRAAVAAVAGSVPFPSLPREYKGDQIRLELNFTYNMGN